MDEEEQEAGPPRPPEGAEDEVEPVVGPAPPKAKTRKESALADRAAAAAAAAGPLAARRCSCRDALAPHGSGSVCCPTTLMAWAGSPTGSSRGPQKLKLPRAPRARMPTRPAPTPLARPCRPRGPAARAGAAV